jgi:hypothetical protein
MSQIQSVNTTQYSMSWLFAAQQAGSTTSVTAPPAQANDPSAAPFDPFSALLGPGTQAPGAGAPAPFSLDAMSALLSAQEQSGTTSANGLSPDQQKVFSELDTDGDGKVTQSELQADFGADNKDLADAVMGKLDTNGDGSIDQSEFAAKTKKSLHHHGHHGGGQGLDALLKATQAASSQSTTNSDGSTTTTLSYADGSTVTMNTPATPTNTDSSVSSGSTQAKSNLLEQLIKMQAQFNAPTSLTTSTSI